MEAAERQAKDGTVYRQIGKDEWEPVTRTAKDGTVFKKVGQNDWSPLEEAAPKERGLIGGIFNTIDKYTGAPVRKAVSEAIKGNNPLKAYGAQFGEETELAPSGAEIAGQLGVPDLTVQEVGPQGYDWKTGQTFERPKEEQKKYSLQDVAGLPISIATDPLTYVPTGGLVRGVSKALGSAGKTAISPFAKGIGKFAVESAPDAEKILEATERIGGRPTKGMLTNNQFISDIESGISQTPTNAGEALALQQQGIRTGVRETSEAALSQKSPLSSIQQGAEAKEFIKRGIEKKLEPAIETYKNLESHTPHIELRPKSVETVAKNIEKLPITKISSAPEATFVKNMANDLRNMKTLEDLRDMKTYVGRASRDATKSPDYRRAAIDIEEKLQKMEQSSILRSSLEASKNAQHGKAVASQMIKEIKDANKVYAQTSNDLNHMARNMGMGKVRNYSEFIRKMEQIPDEQLMSKVFDTSNRKALVELQSQFPEAYETMRKSKIADIYNKSITKGEVSTPKLLTQVKKLPPETRRQLFGTDADQKLKDIETVYNRIGSPVGPSGTPKGQKYINFSIFKPTTWFNELHANVNKWLLDNPQSGLVRGAKKLSDSRFEMPRFSNAPGEGLLTGTSLGLVRENNDNSR